MRVTKKHGFYFIFDARNVESAFSLLSVEYVTVPKYPKYAYKWHQS